MGDYDNKVDLWSVGVIAFMLLSSSLPFYGKTRCVHSGAQNFLLYGLCRFTVDVVDLMLCNIASSPSLLSVSVCTDNM